jgi:polysaccharide export outer membrane protein
MAMSNKTQFGAVVALALAAGWIIPQPAGAQVAPSYAPATTAPAATPIVRDYVVGPQDVLNISSQDDPALSGKFTVEADLTFTFPLIGRVRAGGLTLREVESQLQAKLVEEGFFKDPQIRVSIEQYKSQKVFIVGEVRSPGAYALSGDMRLVEALALAGSTLPTAAGEVVVVPANADSMLVQPASVDSAKAAGASVVRVNLRELQNGAFQQNVQLSGGDTIFVLKAENIYVFGQVKNPGAYPLQQDVTTVLQGLALAGGVTERGATSRVEIVRVVNGEQKKMKVKLDEQLLPGDTIVVPQRFF